MPEMVENEAESQKLRKALHERIDRLSAATLPAAERLLLRWRGSNSAANWTWLLMRIAHTPSYRQKKSVRPSRYTAPDIPIEDEGLH